MCRFKSGIVLRDEREKGGFKLLMSPWTESHSELCIIHKIKDGPRLTFARVEFLPDNMNNAHLVEKYKLTIDEARTPDWFDDEMKEKVAEKMAAYVKSIIVTGDVELLIGGQFIIAPGAKASCKSALIMTFGNSTVRAFGNSKVRAFGNSTVEAWGNSTVEAFGNSTVEAWGNSTVKAFGNSTVEDNRKK